MSDGQTDGRTDRQKSHRKTALHSMQRGKNGTVRARKLPFRGKIEFLSTTSSYKNGIIVSKWHVLV